MTQRRESESRCTGSYALNRWVVILIDGTCNHFSRHKRSTPVQPYSVSRSHGNFPLMFPELSMVETFILVFYPFDVTSARLAEPRRRLWLNGLMMLCCDNGWLGNMRIMCFQADRPVLFFLQGRPLTRCLCSLLRMSLYPSLEDLKVDKVIKVKALPPSLTLFSFLAHVHTSISRTRACLLQAAL